MRWFAVTLLLVPAVVRAGELPWIVDAKRAAELVKGGAVVLDVRAASRRPKLRGAVRISWQQFSLPEGPQHGRLLSAAKLQSRLRSLGLRAAQPVLVVSEPRRGWGTDGRIVWMLRSQGHDRVALVDGGAAALEAALKSGITSASRPGDYRVRRTDRWLADRAWVRRALSNRRVVLVDTRTVGEFRGKTPWGEKRGGHLPGAVHLHFRSLLDASGKLLPRRKLRAVLKSRGITPDRPIIAYCTGGIRSAWVVAVLVHLGFRDVRNYAGSIWEWAASAKGSHPMLSGAPGRAPGR